MKVVLVNGGPHKNGCTNEALKEVAATLQQNHIETEIFWLGNEPVAGCIACGACAKTAKCFRSDMVNLFLEKSEAADGFLFGSPVHYGGASGALTSFLDRVFHAAPSELFAGKPGACVVSCRRGGASAAFDQINKYFGMNNMPIVTSQYWNQVHGVSSEDVRRDEEGMQTMRTLGQNMAWLLRCIQAGRAAGFVRPVYEAVIKTNYIR